MEGLIKGLINVALGGGEERRDDSQSPSEERSRSTWAQVVSGEEVDDSNSSDRNRNKNHGDERRHGLNRWESSEPQNHGDEERDEWREGRESSGSRPTRRPQKKIVNQEYEGYYENRHDCDKESRRNQGEQREGNDGWEVVGKKNQRHQKKVYMDHWNDYKRPPSEQEYSEEAEPRVSLYPTDEELSDLGKACNKLWELDFNRLIPGKDYEIDIGEGKKVHEKGDAARGSLFSWVEEDVFRKPTFSRFCSLLDNYNPNQGHKEVVTAEEKQEQAAFIEEISRTAPIKYLHKYLSSKGILSENYQDFKRVMTNLWFSLYNRGGTYGSSSAFEHVFVGEITQRGEQEVSGFHNWLQFYLEEAKGRVDYQGYILPRRRGEFPDAESQLLTIQFEWNGALKSVSSTLIGVSPEFELALYTLCFYVGGEENHVELGPYPVIIKCYRFGDKLGSAFPVADS